MTGDASEKDRATSDAFGRALLDHLERGEPGLHVLERDDGYVDVMSATVYFGDLEAWTMAERFALEGANGRVLDVGAGAGRISLVLARRGLESVALDVSPGAIEVCRRRGVDHTFLGTVGDLAATPPEEPFDTFVFFGNNLGLLGSPEGAVELLNDVRALSAPGARVIGTMLDPYDTETEAHLAYHERNRERGRLAGQVTLRIRYREHTGSWFDLLWVTPDELAELVGGLGWTIEEIWRQPPFYSVALVSS